MNVNNDSHRALKFCLFNKVLDIFPSIFGLEPCFQVNFRAQVLILKRPLQLTAFGVHVK